MSFEYVPNLSLNVDVYLEQGDPVSAGQLLKFLQQRGWVGASLVTAIEGDEPQQLVELRFLIAENSDNGSILKIDASTGASSLVRAENVLKDLAQLVGAEVYGYIDDEEYFSAPNRFSKPVYVEDESGQVPEIETIPHNVVEGSNRKSLRSVFVAYGNALGSSLSSPDSVSFANEVSRDIKTPITVATHKDISVAIPLDNFSQFPTWVDRFPIVEVVHNNGIQVRWHSKNRPDGKGGKKVFGGFSPRHEWFVSSAVQDLPQACTPQMTGAATSQDTAQVVAGIAHIIEKWVSDLGPSEQDVSEANALAQELSLGSEDANALVSILTDPNSPHETSRILEALGLPETFTKVFTGELEPSNLSNATTVEKGSFAGEINLGGLLKRPEGNKITDRLRRMDFDQPALALVLEVLMVVAGFALIWAGITKWEIFATTWIAWIGYILGAWWLIDGVASIWTWIMIRRQNRSTGQETPKS